MNKWEETPEDYLQDDKGNFILKKDGTPKKKTGRPKGAKGKGYNYHSETKARLKTNKIIREKQKKIKATQSKLNAYQESLKNTKTTLHKINNKEGSKILTTEEVDKAPKSLKEEIKENIIFKANKGPQEDFLAASETDVLYGGAAGGGKSYAMLVDPLRYSHRSAHRALIIRR